MCATKAELRSRFNAYRHSLSIEEYRRIGEQIIGRIQLLPEINTARLIHLYWPMIDRREVDTRPLIKAMRRRGKEIALPAVVSFETASSTELPAMRSRPRMLHLRYTDEENLRLNRWGIAEPLDGSPVAVEDLDAVIVPALGVGRNGHRIGYGFGFYDEFLAETSALKIVPVYEACVVEAVPVDPHDIRVDVLVTESNVYRPA